MMVVVRAVPRMCMRVDVAVVGLDFTRSAEAFPVVGPEGGECVDAVVVFGRFVAEDHYAASKRIQEDVQPPIRRNHCAG